MHYYHRNGGNDMFESLFLAGKCFLHFPSKSKTNTSMMKNPGIRIILGMELISMSRITEITAIRIIKKIGVKIISILRKESGIFMNGLLMTITLRTHRRQIAENAHCSLCYCRISSVIQGFLWSKFLRNGVHLFAQNECSVWQVFVTSAVWAEGEPCSFIIWQWLLQMVS